VDFLSYLSSSATVFFSSNPSVVLVQAVLLASGLLVVFFVLFATRDILLRTNSFLYQVVCIVLVAALPVAGFFIYLLIRPATTSSQRKMQADLDRLIARFNTTQKRNPSSAQPEKEKPKKV
jgi:hypothetical protein